MVKDYIILSVNHHGKQKTSEKRRLKIILAILEKREIVVIIDETGDKKKGKKTDYVKREYIGNLGKRRTIQYWQITTDKKTISNDSSWFVMTKIPNLKYKQVGEIYKIRAQVEQGFRNSKNELGWADFRLTNYADIQKWWELVMCAYLMVCLHNVSLNPAVVPVPDTYQQHSLWDSGTGWKSAPPASQRFPQRIGQSKQWLKQSSINCTTFYQF
jgi:SRSO17 transposase